MTSVRRSTPWASPRRSFVTLGLEVEWVHPTIPLAHPLGGGLRGAILRDVEATADRLASARHYKRILGPLVEAADAVMEDFLGPMTLVPDNPGSFVKLASRGALASIIASGFSSEEAREFSPVSPPMR